MTAPAWILLDKDGVVTEPHSAVLCPGVGKAVHLLNVLGYRVAVATNQSRIGRGEATAAEVHEELQQALHEVYWAGGLIERVYICPHRPDEGCECRKPRPGLLLRAYWELGFEPAATWFVGNSGSDVAAARAAGLRPVLLTPTPAHEHPGEDGLVFEDLAAFARWLEALDG